MSNFTIFLSTFLGTAAVAALSAERILIRLYMKHVETWDMMQHVWKKGDFVKRGDYTYVVMYVQDDKVVVFPTLRTIYANWMNEKTNG